MFWELDSAYLLWLHWKVQFQCQFHHSCQHSFRHLSFCPISTFLPLLILLFFTSTTSTGSSTVYSAIDSPNLSFPPGGNVLRTQFGWTLASGWTRTTDLSEKCIGLDTCPGPCRKMCWVGERKILPNLYFQVGGCCDVVCWICSGRHIHQLFGWSPKCLWRSWVGEGLNICSYGANIVVRVNQRMAFESECPRVIGLQLSSWTKDLISQWTHGFTVYIHCMPTGWKDQQSDYIPGTTVAGGSHIWCEWVGA